MIEQSGVRQHQGIDVRDRQHGTHTYRLIMRIETRDCSTVEQRGQLEKFPLEAGGSHDGETSPAREPGAGQTFGEAAGACDEFPPGDTHPVTVEAMAKGDVIRRPSGSFECEIGEHPPGDTGSRHGESLQWAARAPGTGS